MSADNGIYVLNTRADYQYRVIHDKAIENIFSDYNDNTYNKRWLYEYFKDSKFTYSFTEAMKIAVNLEHKIKPEYGIRVFNYQGSWDDIVGYDNKKKPYKVASNSIYLGGL